MHNHHRLRPQRRIVRQPIPRRQRRHVERLVRLRTVGDDRRVAERGRVCRVARLLGDHGVGQPEQLRFVAGVRHGPRVEDHRVAAVVPVDVAGCARGGEGRVGVRNEVGDEGRVAGLGPCADFVEPQARDGDVGGGVGRPGRCRVPGGPLGDVGFDVGDGAGAVLRVDVADELCVGEVVDGGQVGGPIAVTAVVKRLVGVIAQVAVAAVVARGVRGVGGA